MESSSSSTTSPSSSESRTTPSSSRFTTTTSSSTSSTTTTTSEQTSSTTTTTSESSTTTSTPTPSSTTSSPPPTSTDRPPDTSSVTFQSLTSTTSRISTAHPSSSSIPSPTTDILPTSSQFTLTTQTSVVTITLPNGQASTSTAFAVVTNGQLNGGDKGNGNGGCHGFFCNPGQVGGVFAVVGLVCASLIAGGVYLLWKRKKAQQMESDIVAAASAAAATTRTPFDDDDPEMIEDPSYGNSAATSAAAYGSNAPMMPQYNNYYSGSVHEYEPSHMSAGTAPGFAGMGAYGPVPGAGAGGAAAAAAAGYYGAGAVPTNENAHHYANENAHHYAYDGMAGGPGSNEGAAYYGSTARSAGHENFSQQNHDQTSPQMAAVQPFSVSGAPQLHWVPGQSPPLDAETMAFSPHQLRPEDQLLSPDVFADPSNGSHETTDGRLDMRAHDQGSAASLRDDQDYGRKLAIRNQTEE